MYLSIRCQPPATFVLAILIAIVGIEPLCISITLTIELTHGINQHQADTSRLVGVAGNWSEQKA